MERLNELSASYMFKAIRQMKPPLEIEEPSLMGPSPTPGDPATPTFLLFNGSLSIHWIGYAINGFTTAPLKASLTFLILWVMALPLIFLGLLIYNYIISRDHTFMIRPRRVHILCGRLQAVVFALSLLGLIGMVVLSSITVMENITFYQSVSRAPPEASRSLADRFSLLLDKAYQFLDQNEARAKRIRAVSADRIHGNLVKLAEDELWRLHKVTLRELQWASLIDHVVGIDTSIKQYRNTSRALRNEHTRRLIHLVDNVNHFLLDQPMRMADRVRQEMQSCYIGESVTSSLIYRTLSELHQTLTSMRKQLFNGQKTADALHLVEFDNGDTVLDQPDRLFQLIAAKEQMFDKIFSESIRIVMHDLHQIIGRKGRIPSINVDFFWERYASVLTSMREAVLNMHEPEAMQRLPDLVFNWQTGLLHAPLALLSLSIVLYVSWPKSDLLPRISRFRRRFHEKPGRPCKTQFLSKFASSPDGDRPYTDPRPTSAFSEGLIEAVEVSPDHISPSQLSPDQFFADSPRLNLDEFCSRNQQTRSLPDMLDRNRACKSLDAQGDQRSRGIHDILYGRRKKLRFLVVFLCIFCILSVIDVATLFAFSSLVFVQTEVCQPMSSLKAAQVADLTYDPYIARKWNEFLKEAVFEFIVSNDNATDRTGLLTVRPPSRLIERLLFDQTGKQTEQSAKGLLSQLDTGLTLNMNRLLVIHPLPTIVRNSAIRVNALMQDATKSEITKRGAVTKLADFIDNWMRNSTEVANFLKVWNSEMERSRGRTLELMNLFDRLAELKDQIGSVIVKRKTLDDLVVNATTPSRCIVAARDISKVVEYMLDGVLYSPEVGGRVKDFPSDLKLMDQLDYLDQLSTKMENVRRSGDMEERHLILIRSIQSLNLQPIMQRWPTLLDTYFTKLSGSLKYQITDILETKVHDVINKEFETVLGELLIPMDEVRGIIQNCRNLLCTDKDSNKSFLHHLSATTFYLMLVTILFKLFFILLFIFAWLFCS